MHAHVFAPEAPYVLAATTVAFFVELAAQHADQRALQPQQVMNAKECKYADQQAGHEDPDDVDGKDIVGVSRIIMRIECGKRRRDTFMTVAAGLQDVVRMNT